MLKTNVRPSRDLRNNYREVASMLEHHDHVVITNNGVGETVLMSMDVFNAIEGLLHNQFIYEELQKSKAKMSCSDVVMHDADEVHAELDHILEAEGL